MRISKKQIDPYTIQAHIALDKDELAGYVKDATDAVVREVTVEGFRKGKAPKELVQKQIDPAIVRQEALERALEDSFTKASRQESWDVMNTAELSVLKNDSDTLEYSIHVALWPAMQLPDLATVKVPRRTAAVTDAELAEALDTVINMHATFLDKTGPAADGNRVEVDFDAKIGGELIEGGQSRNHPLIIGGKSFMPGFEEALVGLATGDAKGFSLTAPADYYQSKLAGKTIDFSVTVRRVQTVLKPAVDDAFAKSLGAFENVQQLRERLRQGVQLEKEEKEHQRLRLAILDAIIAAGKVPVPETMVKHELDAMVERFAQDLKGRGIELAMYLARLKKTPDDLHKDWTSEAERQVRITLVVHHVSKTNDIRVSDEELQDSLQATVAELMRTGQVREDQIDPARVRDALAQRMVTDKTLDFIEGQCAVDERQG